jgi:RNA polymerase sigma-70 factor (ECF subfamily)
MRFFKSIKELTDEQLMGDLTKGDKKAFDEIYNRYSQRLNYFFFRMLARDQEKAQDFTHDIFIKLIEKPDLFNQDQKFSTWIFSIANNMCKNEYKKWDVRSRAADELTYHATENSSTHVIEKNLESKEFMSALNNELEGLDEKHRSVFILRYKENFSLKEISEMLQCSEGTVKSRLFYSLKKLSEKLKEYKPQHLIATEDGKL